MDGLYDLFRMDNLNINVTTVFPALVNTRKEFIDQFVANNGWIWEFWTFSGNNLKIRSKLNRIVPLFCEKSLFQLNLRILKLF